MWMIIIEYITIKEIILTHRIICESGVESNRILAIFILISEIKISNI